MQKKVYIASPLNSSGNVEENIEKVLWAAELLIELGHVPFVPHLFHYWNLKFKHSEEFWLKLDLHWIDVCDCVLRLQGNSKGADIETAYAIKKGIKIINSIKEI